MIQVKEGNLVIVNMKGMDYRNLKEFFTTTKQNGLELIENPIRFIVGDKSQIDGIDIGIRSMKRGEQCDFILSPEYAYKK